jgi:hypothetical protein
MLTGEVARGAVPRSGGVTIGTDTRSPVMVVCSPRPRVGRTLVARLLVDYFLLDGRAVVAFDANPNDPVLSEYLPGHAIPATIADTLGQMALFDRLIVNIGVPKVIDLAAEQFAQFFNIMEEIDFVAEARCRAIDTIILYVAEDHPKSIEAYHRILARFPKATVVPVHNEIFESSGATTQSHPARNVMPVHIAPLPTLLYGVIQRPDFSISDFLRRPSDFPTMLHKWTSQPFIAFRDLELRLAMADFASLFHLRS